MSDENEIPLIAQLKFPRTSGEHLASAEMAESLKSFAIQIATMIAELEKNVELINAKLPAKVYSLKFNFNHHEKGIKTEQSIEQDHRTFKLRCYCNGGG